MISDTEQEYVEVALEMFTEHSVALCKERLVALDLRHLFPTMLMLAASGYRLYGSRWIDRARAGIAQTVTDPIRRTSVEWALEALEENE